MSDKKENASAVTTIRLPLEVKKELEAIAASDNRSLNNLINVILTGYIRERKK